MSKSVRCIHKNEGKVTTVEPLHLYLKESFMKKKIDELARIMYKNGEILYENLF